jgi:hypothetical protein
MKTWTRWMIALALLLTLGACGSEDEGGDDQNNAVNNGATNNGANNGTNNGANNGANNGTNNGATNNGANNGANNGTNNGATNNGANNGVVGPVMSCEELPNSNDCFANADCAEGLRCEDVGGEDAIIPCCVPGERGTGQPGEACADENDCETGLCLEGFCTDACDDDAACPETLPCCTIGICLPAADSTCEG